MVCLAIEGIMIIDPNLPAVNSIGYIGVAYGDRTRDIRLHRAAFYR